ncbi:MAG TPA: hypothetical protein VLD67_04005 [Vicinamibacterales bacterium]|nr:hypothetical protein [Vicinamibacterales bacterium]
MTQEIVAIRGGVTSTEALQVFRSVCGGGTPFVRRRLYYPYFWFRLRYRARTLLGETALQVSCLVDARTRVASTSDRFALERVEAGDGDVVEPRLAEDEARGIAERYVAYVVKNRTKALVAPDRDVVDRELIRKPFWIVECVKRPDRSILVDGVTGRFHPLSLEREALPS